MINESLPLNDKYYTNWGGTLKASTLSNRGYERSEHPRYDRQYHVTTPKGSTDVSSSGTPSECCSLISGRSPGVLASLVPPVTESGRFQRPSHLCFWCASHSQLPTLNSPL